MLKTAAVIATVAALAFPAASSAQAGPLAPEVESHLGAVNQFNYRGGVTDPATAPPCGATCQALRSAETRAGQSTAQAQQFQREVTALRTKTGVLPKAWYWARGIGAVTGSFTAGLLIGDFINRKFLRIGMEDWPEPPPGESYYYFTDSEAFPFAQEPDGLYYPETAIFRWVADYRWTADGSYAGRTTITDPANPEWWPGLPGPFRSWDRTANPGDDDTWVHGYLTLEDILRPGKPIEDYGTQPYDYELGSPSDPGASVVEQRLREELESGGYPETEQKLEFELGTPNACDPLEPAVCNPPPPSQRERQKRCDLGDGGAGQDPDPTRTTTINDPALYVMHTPFQRRAEGSTSLVDTALNKGWTEPNSIKEWGGWGWRHVHAKHGWTNDDIAATSAALLTPPIRQQNGRLRYVGSNYSQNGEECARIVIVSDTPRAGEPEPAEIITSYGGLVPE